MRPLRSTLSAQAWRLQLVMLQCTFPLGSDGWAWAERWELQPAAFGCRSRQDLVARGGSVMELEPSARWRSWTVTVKTRLLQK